MFPDVYVTSMDWIEVKSTLTMTKDEHRKHKWQAASATCMRFTVFVGADDEENIGGTTGVA